MQARSTLASAVEFLDITPLARRYGFRFNVKIARELADQAREESAIGCVLRAAADALMMRGLRLETMNPVVFAINTLRAPARILEHYRVAMHIESDRSAGPTVMLDVAH
jgi:hypothetical protein